MDPLEIVGTAKELLPESVQEAVLLPAAKEIGELGGNAVKVITSPLGLPLYYVSKKIDSLRLKIDERFKAIPQENVDVSQAYKTMKILNDSLYSLDQEELQDAYASLIASSLDSRTQNKVHPYYSSLLQDLSGKDVQFLKNIFHYGTATRQNISVIDTMSQTPLRKELSSQSLEKSYTLFYFHERFGQDFGPFDNYQMTYKLLVSSKLIEEISMSKDVVDLYKRRYDSKGIEYYKKREGKDLTFEPLFDNHRDTRFAYRDFRLTDIGTDLSQLVFR